VNKYLYIVLLFFAGSCIEPFRPELDEAQAMLVVNGNITDQPGDHYVRLSYSTSFYNPKFIPLSGCVINVEDNIGVQHTYTELSPGFYKVNLDAGFLELNKAYRLHLFTPDGEEYISDFDSLLSCPEVDDISFVPEIQEGDNVYAKTYGIRFRVDVRGESENARNYLWKLTETYEYHSWYKAQYVWDGDTLMYAGLDEDSIFTCYDTQPIKKFYTASTRYLTRNELNNFPLNYVTNATSRLRIKYSLLVQQHSLSDAGYLYWENMSRQLDESGGLYEKQPATVSGNISNLNNPDEKVLGFFYASEVKEKRIFVKGDLPFNFPVTFCPLDTAYTLEALGDNRLYLVSFSEYEEGPPYGYGNKCFDCTLFGGTVTPPSFWFDDEY
jgi:hypothetical protein